MPSNKNAVIRYMYLDQMLSDRYNKYTCEDLLIKVNERLAFAGYPTIGGDQSDYNHYLKSGKRVIQLDIQALQETPFNMEIDCSERHNGSPVYRYADPTQSLFSKQLSDEEKRLLQEVLNTLGQFAGLDNFEWLHDLQQKLNDSKSFGRTEFDNHNMITRKIISFSSNNYLEGKNHLGTLFSLISNKKVVDVDYEPFGGQSRAIRLYPYLLKQYNDRWYLIGTPTETKDYPYRKDFYINLPLDRMNAIKAVDGIHYIDCDDDLDERFEDIIGVTYNEAEPLTKIILAVKDSFTGYVDTKPIHGSQIKYSQKEQDDFHKKHKYLKGYSFYSIKVKPNKELYNHILMYGENILLVSPKELRVNLITVMEKSLLLTKSLCD